MHKAFPRRSEKSNILLRCFKQPELINALSSFPGRSHRRLKRNRSPNTPAVPEHNSARDGKTYIHLTSAIRAPKLKAVHDWITQDRNPSFSSSSRQNGDMQGTSGIFSKHFLEALAMPMIYHFLIVERQFLRIPDARPRPRLRIAVKQLSSASPLYLY